MFPFFLHYNNMDSPWHPSICQTPQGLVQHGIDIAFLKAAEFWVRYDHTQIRLMMSKLQAWRTLCCCKSWTHLSSGEKENSVMATHFSNASMLLILKKNQGCRIYELGGICLCAAYAIKLWELQWNFQMPLIYTGMFCSRIAAFTSWIHRITEWLGWEKPLEMIPA